MALTWQTGSCHCRKIKFKCNIPKTVDVYKCNCSICWMRQNHHFVVTKENFQLIKESVVSSDSEPTNYKFNTNQATHKFCKFCGVQCYYIPRSNQDGFGVTIYCMDNYQPNTAEEEKIKVIWHDFDGQNWEKQIESSSITSKTDRNY